MNQISIIETRFNKILAKSEKEKEEIMKLKIQKDELIKKQKELLVKLEERGIEDIEEADKEANKLENEILDMIMNIEAEIEDDNL